MTEDSLRAVALRCAVAPEVDFTPTVVDVVNEPPANPPQAVQEKFVGMSFEKAFLEAYSFVSVVSEKVAAHRLISLEEASRIIDFGSGWGRISRLLLGRVAPTSLYALDVDPEMTALVNQTLPGINAMTVTTFPPCALAGHGFDGILSFSVFSHLSEESHIGWAREFGRLVRPGGFAAITVLDASLFDSVRDAQHEVAAGSPSEFATHLAATFPDLDASRRSFSAGVLQFAEVGADGPRDTQHYGWAAAPIPFLERTWGDAGFRIVEYVPANVLFPQALVVMERLPTPDEPSTAEPAALATNPVGHTTSRLGSRVLRWRHRLANR